MIKLRNGLGIVIIGALGVMQAVACSTPDAGETAPEQGNATLAAQAETRFAIVPVKKATSYAGKAIGAWGFERRNSAVSVVTALGDNHEVLFHLTFRQLEGDMLVTAEHKAEQVRITKAGVVQTIVAPQGPSRLQALGGMATDVEVWREGNVFAYDCGSSTAVFLAAVAAVVAACVIPEPAQPAACVAARFAAVAAGSAMAADCQEPPPDDCDDDDDTCDDDDDSGDESWDWDDSCDEYYWELGYNGC
jgi:hypothetical protein